MSRGFGSVEQAISELFNKNRALEMSVRYITIQIRGIKHPSSKQINSTINAIKRLEQKSIVVTKKFSLYSKKVRKPTKTIKPREKSSRTTESMAYSSSIPYSTLSISVMFCFMV